VKSASPTSAAAEAVYGHYAPRATQVPRQRLGGSPAQQRGVAVQVAFESKGLKPGAFFFIIGSKGLNPGAFKIWVKTGFNLSSPTVVRASPEDEKASMARAAAAVVSAARTWVLLSLSALGCFPSPPAATPHAAAAALSASALAPPFPPSSAAAAEMIPSKDGNTPSLRSFCNSLSSALRSLNAVSAPTLSFNPTFWTTM
jgi:hypothetical protein